MKRNLPWKKSISAIVSIVLVMSVFSSFSPNEALKVSASSPPYADNTYLIPQDTNNWTTSTNDGVNDVTIDESGKIIIGRQGYAYYSGSILQNKLAQFVFQLEPTSNLSGAWAGFVLRPSDPSVGLFSQQSGYLIIILDGAIQLLKIGSGFSITQLGATISNSVIKDNGVHKIRTGTITEGSDVRVVFEIDDNMIFDYLDSDNPIMNNTSFMQSNCGEVFTGILTYNTNYYEKTFVLPSNSNYWDLGSQAYKTGYNDGVVIAASGAATYKGSSMNNRLFQMSLQSNIPDGSWTGIFFRQSQSGKGFSQQYAYLVYFENNMIGLLNIKNGVGYTIDTPIFHDGKQRTVRFGAIDEGEDVRIIVDVDGINFVNYLDTSPDKIKTDSYFSVNNYGDFGAAYTGGQSLVDNTAFANHNVSSDGKYYVSNIQLGSTIGDFKNDVSLNLGNGETLAFKDENGNEITDNNIIIKTGFTVDISFGGFKANTYIMVIYGDVNSDGAIDLNDLVSVRNCLLGDHTISDTLKYAGDLYGEGSITLNDLVGMMAYISGTGTINQNPG